MQEQFTEVNWMSECWKERAWMSGAAGNRRLTSDPANVLLREWLSGLHGRLVYRQKHPFCGGSTHVVLEPMDFIPRLAALA